MALPDLLNQYQTTFDNMWQHKLQQSDSRILGAVSRSKINGKERKFHYGAAASDMNAITTRNGESIPSADAYENRFIRPVPYDYITWLDEFDDISLGELPLPESFELQRHTKSAMRKIDDVIIAAMSGTAWTGATGTTATALPSGSKVAVTYDDTVPISAVNTGFTLSKWRRAKYLMDSQEVPQEGRYIALTAQQLQEALLNTEINSIDYNDVKALVEGRVARYLGMDVIMTQRLALNSSTDIRSCLAWQKDGVMFGEAAGRKARLDILPGQTHTIQIRTTQVIEAVRLHEASVVEIACDESP